MAFRAARPKLARVHLRWHSSRPAAGTELTAPNGRTWSQPLGLFIDNAFVESSDGQRIASTNPTTEEEICSVHAATAADVDAAVGAARRALGCASWKSLSGTERGALMMRLADLAGRHAETLATAESVDNGKPYARALRDHVPEFQNVLRYYAGYADKNPGSVIDVGPAKLAYTVREPVGVCAQIVPWNYPLDMAAWKLGPALCCGNTVVLKPAEQTPLSALLVARLVAEAGFPPGVVNIVNGQGSEAGAALVRHPGVDKVAFTGSTATGKEVMRAAAATMKSLTLETGGKSPLIILEDADLDLAALWAYRGAMDNQGQVCSATSRVLVHDKVYDEFMGRFLAAVERETVVGDPFEETTTHGPQITRAHYERILGYIESGRREGATILAGGGPAPRERGFFVAPTVLADVSPHMAVYREEIFGPCAVVARFASEAEAVRMANDTPYGLGAALFTRDLARAHRVAGEIEAGMVWINSSNDSDFRVPFGGVKQSGFGRELGEAGLGPYYTTKSIHVNLESR